MALSIALPPYSKLFAASMCSFLRDEVVSKKALQLGLLKDKQKWALANFVEECCQSGSEVLDTANRKGLRLAYQDLFQVPK
jgi:hypothetical protein